MRYCCEIVSASFSGRSSSVSGPERTGISKEIGLLQDWPKDGPALHFVLFAQTDLPLGQDKLELFRIGHDGFVAADHD